MSWLASFESFVANPTVSSRMALFGLFCDCLIVSGCLLDGNDDVVVGMVFFRIVVVDA